MDVKELVLILDDYLGSEGISDYCPNGLQVEGEREIRKIVTGVSASKELMNRAIEEDADAVLVHHGILWNSSEAPRIIGVFRQRVSLLLGSGLSLLAYHLPLDRHVEVGNAAVMARKLGLERLESFGKHAGYSIGVKGSFPAPVELAELERRLTGICMRKPEVFGRREMSLRNVGIVTGAGDREYHQAVAEGLDAYITGEAAEWVFQQAAEEGRPFIAAGHYATERFGIQALGAWIAEHYAVKVKFVDLPNPI